MVICVIHHALFLNRILDNLLLVFPIPRPDQENSFVYQHGFHVGLRGQYAGVSADRSCPGFIFYENFAVHLCKPFLFLYMHDILQSKEQKHFIHNHLAFTVKFHKDAQTDSARIVGFEVKPFRLSFMIICYIGQVELSF